MTKHDLLLGQIYRWLQMNGLRTAWTLEFEYDDVITTEYFRLVLGYSFDPTGKPLEPRCLWRNETQEGLLTNCSDKELERILNILLNNFTYENQNGFCEQ